MLCKGSVQELTGKRDCWLPADTTSTFRLCRRCHFYRVTEILDVLTQSYESDILHPPYELFLSDKHFLQELLHPGREQALLHLLASLSLRNTIQFQSLLERFKSYSVFSILLTKRIQAHQHGPRCKMYRKCMLDPKLYMSELLCWNCWPCIAWILKQKNSRLLQNYTNNFGLFYQRLTFDQFTNIGPRIFVDFLVSLHLLQKDHHIRIFIDHCFRHFPLDDLTSFLTQFFQSPVMLFLFFEEKQNEFLPLPLRDVTVVSSFKQKIKQHIKQKTDTYKEELVMRTWHPSRLFTWCFDIEELKDFD